MIEQPRSTLDFRCMTCGYGVARPQPPERCPMCAGSRWRQHLQTHEATSMRLEMRRLRRLSSGLSPAATCSTVTPSGSQLSAGRVFSAAP